MDRSDTNTFGVCALKLQAVMINFKMFYVHSWQIKYFKVCTLLYIALQWSKLQTEIMISSVVVVFRQ